MAGSIPGSTPVKFTTFGDLLRFLRQRVGMAQTDFRSGAEKIYGN